jgi:hypothetical protein
MIDRSEVNQMAKFIAAMNSSGGGDSKTTNAAPPADGAVAAMKTILEKFHSAADNVVTDASYDRPLREALVTEATSTGARVGSWEIRVNQEGHYKQYEVVNVVSGEPLASNLLLYEAAHGLVRILNEDGRINSVDAIALLRAEQEYGARVHDMVLYRHRLDKAAPNDPRLMVFEARYSDAKRRAMTAREQVRKLSRNSI